MLGTTAWSYCPRVGVELHDGIAPGGALFHDYEAGPLGWLWTDPRSKRIAGSKIVMDAAAAPDTSRAMLAAVASAMSFLRMLPPCDTDAIRLTTSGPQARQQRRCCRRRVPRPASGSGRAVVSENPVEVARAERVLGPCCATNVDFAAETGCDTQMTLSSRLT